MARYTKKLPYTDMAVDAWHFYWLHPWYLEQLAELPSQGVVSLSAGYRSGGVSDPTARFVEQRDELLKRHRARIADWRAASAALSRLQNEPGGDEKVKVLRSVYNTRQLSGVGSRVLKAALDVPVSEPTAWAWIKRANRYWAEERGVV